uniref:Cytochrome b561 bacterial/Ni-hydrogenase domain-containing protein n=2 Tax=Pinguiococcus pyrenoidosus TaxID=172671 RepID=A0A7R9YFG3_9STRA|mmetsp:Transcript_8288/g.31171  ORF Transcript_8288/g.31171 Transcript_8288/m.31171 type:complete len:150 (+) Transcript_8288:347-796(+)
MNTKDKKLKGTYMRLHKSWGLVVAGLVVPRILLRVVSKVPAHLPGNALEKLGGTLSHLYLYAMLVFMPASGIAMGYYGGKGLPFFGYKIPGAGPEQKNGSIAKNAYLSHKKLGQVFEYFVPIHVGAVGYHHLIKGHNALRRINPFARAK